MGVYLWNDTWLPGPNTVAYYPFTSDILDHSGNGNDFSGSGYSFSNNKITLTSDLASSLIVPTSGNEPRTINLWCDYNSSSTNGSYRVVDTISGSSVNCALFNNSSGRGASVYVSVARSWYETKGSATNSTCLITFVRNGTTVSVYINGTLLGTKTAGSDQWSWDWSQIQSELKPGTYGEIVVENKARTADQVAGYYDQTKSQYGIS